jgi:acyl carrier protein
MSGCTAEDVRAFLLAKFLSPLTDRALKPEQVPDSFDFFKEGIIDSLGLLEMISDVERRFGIELDMAQLDAEQLTILGPFCLYVSTQSRNKTPA